MEKGSVFCFVLVCFGFVVVVVVFFQKVTKLVLNGHSTIQRSRGDEQS
jgi:CHASE3 domain sensor protein